MLPRRARGDPPGVTLGRLFNGDFDVPALVCRDMLGEPFLRIEWCCGEEARCVGEAGREAEVRVGEALREAVRDGWRRGSGESAEKVTNPQSRSESSLSRPLP